MSSGNASHKGFSVKPNTNAEGKLDTAADQSVDPGALLPEGEDAHRAEQSPKNEKATERRNQSK